MDTPEHWVGTWRPHKPIAPISAHFVSPGPKYAMPGLTGSFKHDPTKMKAPMFSFGTSYDKTGSDLASRPKARAPCNITKLGREGGNAFLCFGPTKGSGLLQTPGPGPAAYKLPPVLGPKASPSFSLSSRTLTGSFLKDLKKSPGPAAYTVVDPCTYKQKPPQFSMTGRNFAPISSTRTPGAGSHYPERVTMTKANAPSFSFGIRHSQYVLTQL